MELRVSRSLLKGREVLLLTEADGQKGEQIMGRVRDPIQSLLN